MSRLVSLLLMTSNLHMSLWIKSFLRRKMTIVVDYETKSMFFLSYLAAGSADCCCIIICDCWSFCIDGYWYRWPRCWWTGEFWGTIFRYKYLWVLNIKLTYINYYIIYIYINSMMRNDLIGMGIFHVPAVTAMLFWLGSNIFSRLHEQCQQCNQLSGGSDQISYPTCCCITLDWYQPKDILCHYCAITV